MSNLHRLQFDGDTFIATLDGHRLGRQLARIFNLVKDQHWHTLNELAQLTGFPEGSISARLRDLRKNRFGGHEILRRRCGKGLFEYRFRYCRQENSKLPFEAGNV
jgi:hypothetical protein